MTILAWEGNAIMGIWMCVHGFMIKMPYKI